jgi:hypothetical protein
MGHCCNACFCFISCDGYRRVGAFLILIDNPTDVLFGRGFGQYYQLDVEFFMSLGLAFSGDAIGAEFMTGESWQNADSVYTPMLFCGGLSLFLVFSYLILSGIKLIKVNVYTGNRIQYAWVGVVILYFAVAVFFEILCWIVMGHPLSAQYAQ